MKELTATEKMFGMTPDTAFIGPHRVKVIYDNRIWCIAIDSPCA